MNDLRWIESEIDRLKFSIDRLRKINKNGDVAIQEKRLNHLQQIKAKLEAWEVINNRFEYFEMEEGDVFVNKQEIFAQTSPFDNNDLKIVKKVVVMKNDKMS